MHIAEKTTREWIFAWIKNPQAYASTATMPNFQLSDDDARDISAFLISQSTPFTNAARKNPPVPKPDDAAAIQQGASVYGESFCASCHAMQNAAGLMTGGNVGPELTRVGSKVKPEWLAEWLRNPKVYDGSTAMPHYRFDREGYRPGDGLSGRQIRLRFPGEGQLGAGHGRANRPRQNAGQRARVRDLPRNQRNRAAG